MKTTEKQVVLTFERFIKNLGGRVAKSYDDHGAYRLDYNSVYGGYVIERISDTGTGVSLPFGALRRKAGEMWDTLYFAILVLENQKIGV